jgi:hypothetical protein
MVYSVPYHLCAAQLSSAVVMVVQVVRRSVGNSKVFCLVARSKNGRRYAVDGNPICCSHANTIFERAQIRK